MNNVNENEKLTTSDKDKEYTLSDFFSSVFTTECNVEILTLEDINLTHGMDTSEIEEEN